VGQGLTYAAQVSGLYASGIFQAAVDSSTGVRAHPGVQLRARAVGQRGGGGAVRRRCGAPCSAPRRTAGTSAPWPSACRLPWATAVLWRTTGFPSAPPSCTTSAPAATRSEPPSSTLALSPQPYALHSTPYSKPSNHLILVRVVRKSRGQSGRAGGAGPPELCQLCMRTCPVVCRQALEFAPPADPGQLRGPSLMGGLVAAGRAGGVGRGAPRARRGQRPRRHRLQLLAGRRRHHGVSDRQRTEAVLSWCRYKPCTHGLHQLTSDVSLCTPQC